MTTRACARWPQALMFLSALAACDVHAQAAAPAEGSAQRPRIGLALSGGGARGAAHIGVLKVLEEMRVPVHCVAGTSMGAVVGGAYAAGTTPSEMERLIASTDWTDVFTDRPPREEIAVRRKIDDYKHLFAPEFGVRDGGLLMPRGVVAGVTIEQFLRRLAAPASGIADFSALPIPYRAVAADIESGGQVVIEKGSLVQAMRASMAIPGAVTPVDVNGQLLVDGGIANNLPIDVVRATCADVVIAVNISTPPMKRGEITSALSVVAQLVNLLGKDRVDQQLKSMGDLDVLISPELGSITAGSFDRQAEAIGIGEAAARSMASVLARYSLPPAEYAELRLSQSAAEKSLGRVDEIRFEGIQRTNPEVLATLIESKPGEALSDETLAADLRRIYGRGDFEAVDYRIDHTSSGGRALVIPVREKEIGPDYLRFGVGMATDFSDEAVFSLLLSYRRSWLNRAGGEWLTEAQIGKSNYLFSEFYQPLERAGHLFVAPYGQVGQTLLGFSDHDQRVAEYRVREARLGMDVGVNLGTWGEARFGPLVRDISATVATGDPVLPRADAKVAGLRFSLFGDTNDTPWFPRSGHRVSVTAFASTDEWGNAPSYRRLEASWSGAYSFGAHTATVTLKGGAGIDSRLPAYDAFELGGPLAMSGYHIRQFTGERMAFASLNYYNQWVRLPSLLGSGTYVGGTIEAGRMDRLYDGRASTGTLWSGSLYLAAETFLGPGFLGFGFNRNGGSTLYLVIGVP